MKIAFFNSKSYDIESFNHINETFKHEIEYFKPQLDRHTAALAEGFPAICAFVNDTLSADIIEKLACGGTRLIALRAAGYNNVDIAAAQKKGITVARVPAYSPEAVAEHAIALIMTLNRKVHRAYQRVREGNFSLEGLLGFNLGEKTIGIVGTGRIGECLARMLTGFGCTVLCYDVVQNPKISSYGARYVELNELFAQSDIISLHCPLTPQTHYIINESSISLLKRGAMIINTSRGSLIDTKALIKALKSGQIGSVGLDVYEEEADLFFEDLSDSVIQDDVFARLLTFPNVIITGHQAFFTDTAIHKIAEITLANISEFENTGKCSNAVK